MKQLFTSLFLLLISSAVISQNENVGIGTTSPAQKLHVAGSVFVENKIGIGVSNPNAPLQFSNVFSNRKIVFLEGANNDHQYYGIGINPGQLRYQVDVIASSHVFFAGVSPTQSSELMRIQGNGNVGIGTATPTQRLHVSGTAFVTDKIGIGISTPNGALQFSNVLSNRKIVFHEVANNDHQYYGIGINPGQLRYQVDALASSHVFFAAESSSQSKELMRITGNGNVGIGVSNPNAPLQFSVNTANRKIVLSEYVNNDHQFVGFGTEGYALRYQVSDPTVSHVFYAGAPPGQSIELMRIKGNGNIGIGVSDPNAPLQFSNSLGNRKLVLVEGVNNDHQFYGFGVNNATLRFQVNSPDDSHVFYAATSSSTSSELVRIKGNGNVGIGVSNPNAPLQFSNVFINRKIVFFEGVNNDHQFCGLGANVGQMRYQVDSPGSSHVFYAGTSASTSNELMRIKGNGNITVTGVIETENFIIPTLNAGFTQYGGEYPLASYYKDKMGRVHLRGLVNGTNPQGQVIFNLPAGYRPATSGRLIFPVINNNALGRIDVKPNGDVYVDLGVPGFMSLDGISFKAD